MSRDSLDLTSHAKHASTATGGGALHAIFETFLFHMSNRFFDAFNVW